MDIYRGQGTERVGYQLERKDGADSEGMLSDSMSRRLSSRGRFVGKYAEYGLR